MEEAVSGVKGALATKVYGDDLKVLEEKSDQIVEGHVADQGVEDLGVFRVLGQPNLNVTVDREAAARYQINVADVQDAIQTAVGGNALTQVLKDEARYDLTLRYLPKYRDTQEAIENIRLLAPIGRTGVAGAVVQDQGDGRRVGSVSRRQPAICCHQVQRARARPGKHGGRGDQESERSG